MVSKERCRDPRLGMMVSAGTKLSMHGASSCLTVLQQVVMGFVPLLCFGVS